ncbi:hypothetical protein Acsp03_71460 [Actinomadura sp. NBRC 104412]|uniref:hypothetical protein n=1 Tax=Actinomadura sp. NBRC 104412 TaxID=3032203 RepID=UPI0024A2ABF5|nr:hypothetical protein [Actinomadura sp. NBRC 104412]GLZ09680.1 hypothetical protein Acsp03_71460 [Actinomadura sp. NBRC 104412]
MIIPVRMPDDIPDYSRLAEWTAVCDSCPARTALGEVADWLISRTQDGHIYCPPCADHSAKQLLTTVFPTGRHRRPARTPAQLRELLGRLVARLPRHGGSS